MLAACVDAVCVDGHEENAEAPAAASVPSVERALKRRRAWWQWPGALIGFGWNVASLLVLLAVVAAIPIVQLASLGYILSAAANLSRGERWGRALPGLRLAGRLATFMLLAALLWLPVYLVSDLSYSVQLLRPGSSQAAGWRGAAFAAALLWLTWITWAAMRGGRWWHMLWPAPWRFVTRIWRPATWSRAADDLLALVQRLHIVSLWWLGLRAAVGALVWIAIPVSLMIIGLRAQQLEPAALVGLVGALGLTWVMLYLPLLQFVMAEKNRFREIFAVRVVRRRVRRAPWAIGCSLILLFALCLPLYLLRIEATPEQLTWLPSLLFVGLMFPAKLALGAALACGARPGRPRQWLLRWSARWLTIAATLVYVGALYVAQFIAWQGIYVMYFQHAVLVPVAS
jgi:hypothetical protein